MHYTRAVLSVGALRILSVLLAALFLAGVTAVVPPQVYGRYILVLSCAQVVVGALLAWPNQGFLRYGREEFTAKSGIGGFLGARLALHGGLLALLVPAAVLLGPVLAEWADVGEGVAVLFLVMSFAIMPLSDMGGVAAQATGRFLAFGTSVFVQRLLQVAVIGFIYAGLSATWEALYLASLAGYALAAILAWLLVPREAWAGLRVRSGDVRRLVAYGRLLPVSIMAAYLITWMDAWFIKFFLDAAYVGQYSWAYSVTLVATTLLVPVAAVLGPKAVDLHLSGEKGRQHGLSQGIRSACLLLAALVPLGLGLVALACAVLPLGDYGRASSVLLILCAGVAFQAGMALVEPRIYADERLVPRAVVISVAMAGLNALGNLLLIPRLGIEGAAFATAAAYGAGMFMQWTLLGMPRAGPVLAGLAGVGVAALFAVMPPAWSLSLGGALTVAALALGRATGRFSGLSGVLPAWAAVLVAPGVRKSP
ncbi:polysaccharide biosynthesis protein [Alkalidesulfovibrio alkalitolerans DSM 16529]|uniref:Polysaccharide biosynthesis protein n=1 Tax=Alkalidesulfovibrio alkalitolerans DSM 16529 TaxID=1121439 RepID=S7TGE0_9BACT|nr:oligosaccharide flippase family protein [Alkalidesulfovibrio alkalitolerans]EPR36267.1 polysaccharide biosynthesis protein [Alkalidesulfovibrio alkalitolerans DSM 16529]